MSRTQGWPPWTQTQVGSCWPQEPISDPGGGAVAWEMVQWLQPSAWSSPGFADSYRHDQSGPQAQLPSEVLPGIQLLVPQRQARSLQGCEKPGWARQVRGKPLPL